MDYTDFLIRLKNAQLAKKNNIEVPFSKARLKISEILKQGGFLKKVEVKTRPSYSLLKLELNQEKPIRGIRFLSRLSLKRYSGYRDFYKVKSGFGLLIVSTPKGIMTAEEAKKLKVGGQLLFEIW